MRDKLKPVEVASRLGIGLTTVYRWVRSGRLRSEKGQKGILIPASEVHRLKGRRRLKWDRSKAL